MKWLMALVVVESALAAPRRDTPPATFDNARVLTAWLRISYIGDPLTADAETQRSFFAALRAR